jgi:hypothetical protein
MARFCPAAQLNLKRKACVAAIADWAKTARTGFRSFQPIVMQ